MSGGLFEKLGNLVRVISWNVKNFASAILLQGNASRVIRQVVADFDMAVIYEVPNSAGGVRACRMLLAALPGYRYFSEPTDGWGNEDDRIAVFWNNAVATVNRTPNRCPNGFGGRRPIYFTVANPGGRAREMCAWHAPAPGEMDSYIANDWSRILGNSVDGPTGVTGLIMGDFNAQLDVPKKRGAGRQFARQIAVGAPNGTTLKPGLGGVSGLTAAEYRSANTYDQFYTDAALVQPNGSGLYDVIGRLATNAAPFTGHYQYNTTQKAYGFYLGSISDHLPVGINVGIRP